jgi:hypothetical protein
MIDILTWLWHDPLLQGSRGSRFRSVNAPQLRPDLVALEARRRKKAIANGTYVPPPPLTTPARPPGEPRSFKPEYVVQLAARVREHLPIPHRFICITDEPPEGKPGEGVVWLPTPAAALAAGSVRSPEGDRFPSCYRRLWAQSEAAARELSEWVLLIDMDLVPVADWSPLIRPTLPFIGWRPYRDWGRQKRIGGGIYGFQPGANRHVWDDFIKDPRAAVAEARVAGFRGSDQAWLSYKLAHKVPIYGRDTGIYSIRDLGHTHDLPKDARMVQFNGPVKPWGYRGPAEWVARHWNGR